MNSKNSVQEYKKVIDSFYTTIKKVPEKYTYIRLAQDKWALKEIIGHLIDSAVNNHQRFVRLQITDLTAFPGYEQEKWLQIQKVNDFDWNELIELWRLYNLLLIHIIENIDESTLYNVWTLDGKEYTLDFIVNDYYEHMKWHIGHFEKRLAEVMTAVE